MCVCMCVCFCVHVTCMYICVGVCTCVCTCICMYYYVCIHNTHSYMYTHVPYSGKILRTINFAVFEDFTTASKINSSKSYYSIESYDISLKFTSQNVSWRDNLKNFLPQKLLAIQYFVFTYLHNALATVRLEIFKGQKFC